MLYIVLLLVLAALGLLVAALVTSQSLFAWISIVLSLLAAGALLVDWLLRRRADRRATAEQELADDEIAEVEAATAEQSEVDASDVDASDVDGSEVDAEVDAELAADAGESAPDAGELVPDAAETADEELPTTVVVPAADLPTANVVPAEPEPAQEPVAQEPATVVREPVSKVDDGAVPDEEETDAADLLIVCELDDQVVVVDEHPRYHLADCGWLHEKDIIPIAVAEARELGFTPCARCGPDAKLAGQARRKRVAGRG